MGLREEKKLDMQRAIVETTLGMFRRAGFEKTRVRDVAALLRISEATFFNYFPSKCAVLDAAAAELCDGVVRRVLETGVDDPVPERLTGLTNDLAEEFQSDRQLARLLSAHSRFLLGTRAEPLEQSRRQLTELFERGQERGEIRTDVPATQLSDVFLSATLSTVDAWVTNPGAEGRLDERLAATLRVILSGSCVRSGAGTSDALASGPLDHVGAGAGS